MVRQYLVGLSSSAAKRNLHLSALRGFSDRLVKRVSPSERNAAMTKLFPTDGHSAILDSARLRLPYPSGESTDQGFAVRHIGECSYTAGIRPGDIIRSIAGKEIKSPSDLAQCVADRLAGEQVSVRLNRQGKLLKFVLELAGEVNPRSN